MADVVPSESPAGWGTLGGAGPQGQAWGFQELEAQAVAVRSYVMSGLGSYGGYADTCDLDCQTYRGTLNENALTDLAATDTAGQVMESRRSGGGHAVLGVDRRLHGTGDVSRRCPTPATPCACPGACNPNHTWTASVPVSTIEATWPQLGTLESITITGRNGSATGAGRVTCDDPGRVGPERLADRGHLCRRLGLKSDWFTTATGLGAAGVAMAPTPDGGGYWIDGGQRCRRRLR